METIRNDYETVKTEFDGLSTPTQIFIATLVGLGILLGVVLGGWLGYGIAVEEHENRDCIEYEDDWYCLDEAEDGNGDE
jgi:hypothetical protein